MIINNHKTALQRDFSSSLDVSDEEGEAGQITPGDDTVLGPVIGDLGM